MAERTDIEWADGTWSPWEGCTAVSPGCKNCYAEAMNKWLRKGVNWGPGAPRREYGDDHWELPLKWQRKLEKEGRVESRFPSVCDPFDNEVAIEWLRRFCDLIELTPNIMWLLLTKRIGNVEPRLAEAKGKEWLAQRQNVRLGATIVNPEELERDIVKLLRVRVRSRFVSLEPLLARVDLTPFFWGKHEKVDQICQQCPRDVDCLCGYHTRKDLGLPSIDWVIVGGESGRGARDFDITWVDDIIQGCRGAGVPVFVKQLGARPVWSEKDDGIAEPPFFGRIKLVHKKGGDINEFPEHLRVREFPNG